MTRLIINLKHLRHNIQEVRKMAYNKKILIPVKANAYGHGIIPVSHFLEKQQIDYLAVAFSSEGRIIREEGIKTPILIFGIIDDMRDVFQHNLTPTVYSEKEFKELKKAAAVYKKTIPVHINIDTGMGRIGIPVYKAYDFIIKILQTPYIKLEGIYTHFASADSQNSSYTDYQLEKFTELLALLQKNSISVPLIHAANSSAILNYPDSYFNMVRPGIMIYGYSANTNIMPPKKIKPVLSLKTKIFYTKTVPPKTSIGYNNNYITKKKETIATLPIGYGDGYNRLLSNKGKTIIHDQWADIVGNISMDQTTIRLPSSNIKIGADVTLIGKSKTKKITVETIAEKLNTIPYEVVCNFNNRITRIYKE